ncbi:hypothetical protein K1719_047021 [Acacia pycnantha]|nr:hypothetical protein K1719_047021 [Acacia pycnantha]
MDACQVLQSLDSIWFFTNIFTRSDDPLPSLSPPKCDSYRPHSGLMNLQDESDEIVETVNVNTPCEPETEVKDRGGGKREGRGQRGMGPERLSWVMLRSCSLLLHLSGLIQQA